MNKLASRPIPDQARKAAERRRKRLLLEPYTGEIPAGTKPLVDRFIGRLTDRHRKAALAGKLGEKAQAGWEREPE
jgi:hypothetical protein